MQSIFVLLVVLGCISAVSTYQCYVCANTLKGSCGDPFDANSMNDSDKMEVPTGGACMKAKVEGSGVVQIGRLPTAETALCVGGVNGCKKVTKNGQTGRICCCTSNLCNGVSTLQQQPLTIAFFTITTFAMFIYRFF